jgi:ribosomal protein S18 acetylase RimI-like enzyme
MSTAIRIVPYAPQHRDAFRDLNLAWIREHFEVEDRDLRDLGDPERYILGPGGYILVAEADRPDGSAGEVVGVCALVAEGHGVFELAKMAVAPAARGMGLGTRLVEAAIMQARAAGARRVELLSNTRLAAAIALYRKLGFVEVPLPRTEYVRANIKMELPLRDGRPATPRSDRT